MGRLACLPDGEINVFSTSGAVLILAPPNGTYNLDRVDDRVVAGETGISVVSPGAGNNSSFARFIASALTNAGGGFGAVFFLAAGAIVTFFFSALTIVSINFFFSALPDDLGTRINPFFRRSPFGTGGGVGATGFSAGGAIVTSGFFFSSEETIVVTGFFFPLDLMIAPINCFLSAGGGVTIVRAD